MRSIYRLAGLLRRECVGCVDVQDCAWAGRLDGVPHLDGPIQRACDDVALHGSHSLISLRLMPSNQQMSGSALVLGIRSLGVNCGQKDKRWLLLEAWQTRCPQHAPVTLKQEQR